MAGLWDQPTLTRKPLWAPVEEIDPQQVAVENTGSFGRGLHSAVSSQVGAVQRYVGANDAAAQNQAEAARWAPDVQTTDQIDDFSTGAQYVAGHLGSAAASLPVGLAGGVAGRLAAGARGAYLGATAAYQPIMAGGHMQELDVAQPGMSEGDKRLRATGVGALQAGLEGVGPAWMTNRVFKPSAVVKAGLMPAVGRAGKVLATDAALEGAGAAGSDVLGQGSLMQLDPSLKYNPRQTFEAGVGEAVGGAGMGAVHAPLAVARDYLDKGARAGGTLAGQAGRAAMDTVAPAVGRAYDSAADLMKTPAEFYTQHPEFSELMKEQEAPGGMDMGDVVGVNKFLDEDGARRSTLAKQMAQRILDDEYASNEDKHAAQSMLETDDVDAWKPFTQGVHLRQKKERVVDALGRFSAYVGEKAGAIKKNSELTPQDVEFFKSMHSALSEPTGLGAEELVMPLYALKQYVAQGFVDKDGAVNVPDSLIEALDDQTLPAITKAFEVANVQAGKGRTFDVPTQIRLREIAQIISEKQKSHKSAANIVRDNLTPSMYDTISPEDLNDIAHKTRDYLHSGKVDKRIEMQLHNLFGASKERFVKQISDLYKPGLPRTSRLGDGDVLEEGGKTTNYSDDTGSDADLSGDWDNPLSDDTDKPAYHFGDEAGNPFDMSLPHTEGHIQRKAAGLDASRWATKDDRATGKKVVDHYTVGVAQHANDTGDYTLLDKLKAEHKGKSSKYLDDRFKVMVTHEKSMGEGAEGVDIDPRELKIPPTKGGKPNKRSWQDVTKIGSKDVSTIANGRLYLTPGSPEKINKETGEVTPEVKKGEQFITSAHRLIEKMWEKKGRGAFDEGTSEQTGAKDKLNMFAAGLTSLLVSDGFHGEMQVKMPDGKMKVINGMKDLPDDFVIWHGKDGVLTLGEARAEGSKKVRKERSGEMRVARNEQKIEMIFSSKAGADLMSRDMPKTMVAEHGKDKWAVYESRPDAAWRLSTDEYGDPLVFPTKAGADKAVTKKYGAGNQAVLPYGDRGEYGVYELRKPHAVEEVSTLPNGKLGFFPNQAAGEKWFMEHGKPGQTLRAIGKNGKWAVLEMVNPAEDYEYGRATRASERGEGRGSSKGTQLEGRQLNVDSLHRTKEAAQSAAPDVKHVFENSKEAQDAPVGSDRIVKTKVMTQEGLVEAWAVIRDIGHAVSSGKNFADKVETKTKEGDDLVRRKYVPANQLDDADQRAEAAERKYQDTERYVDELTGLPLQDKDTPSADSRVRLLDKRITELRKDYKELNDKIKEYEAKEGVNAVREGNLKKWREQREVLKAKGQKLGAERTTLVETIANTVAAAFDGADSTRIVEKIDKGKATAKPASALRKIQEARAAAKLAGKPAEKKPPPVKFNRESTDLHRTLNRDGFPATHDSPIKHEGKFDWRSHIGKGEGNSSYGAGTYLSTADGVHKSYKKQFTAYARDKNSQMERFVGNPNGEDPGMQTTAGLFYQLEMSDVPNETYVNLEKAFSESIPVVGIDNGDRLKYTYLDKSHMKPFSQNSISEIKSFSEDTAAWMTEFNAALSGISGASPTYHVSVNIKPEELMDWDKPLSEQSKFFDHAFYKISEDTRPEFDKEVVDMDDTTGLDGYGMGEFGEITRQSFNEFFMNAQNDAVGPTGKIIYEALTQALGSQAKASDYLQSLGIMGHKYASAHGRNDEHPNYVIYDDSRIETNYVSFNREAVGREGDNAKNVDAIEAIYKRIGKEVDAAFASTKTIGGSATWSRDPKTGKAIIRIATEALDPLSMAYHESMHEFFQRLLDDDRGHAAGVLQQAADSELIIRALERHFQHEPGVLADLKKDPAERVAYMYQLWAAGKLTVGPQTETIFRKLINMVRKVFGLMTADKQALEIMMEFDRGNMSNRSAMARVLDTQAARGKYIRKVGTVMKPVLDNVAVWGGFAENALVESGNPALIRIGQLMNNKTGSQNADIGYIAAHIQAENMWMNKFSTVFRNGTKADVGMALDYLQKGERPVDPVVRGIYDNTKDVFEKMHTYLSERGVQRFDAESKKWVPIAKIKGYFPVSWDAAKIISDSGKFIKMLHEHHAKELGAVAKQANDEVSKGGHAGKYTASWTKLDTADTKPVTADDVAVAIMNRIISANGQVDFQENENALGFSPVMKSVNQRTLHWIDQSVFHEFQQKDMARIISSYVGQATKRAEYSHRFGPDGDVLQTAMEEAWEFEIDKIMKDKYKVEGAVAKAKATNVAAWQDELGKLAGEDVESKEILTAATKKLEPARKAVMAMEGTLGADISPLLRKANAFSIVYTNTRLLGYSLFANFIDPLGIMVRGGEMKDAYEAFKRGMRDVVRNWGALTGLREAKPGDIDEATRVAEMIGTVDSAGFMNTIGSLYGSQYLPEWARNWNDSFFRWNGMESFNKAMRVQATQAAISFIKRHYEKPNEHSERYWKELTISRDDVKIGEDGSLNIESPQIQRAIMLWVDGAIMRPNAAIRPSMSSDPHYATFYHLKQFMYAAQAVLLKRVQVEVKNGNTDPLMILMAGFVPTMLAADAAKGLLQEAMGAGAPAWTHESLGGVVVHGVQRAGLLGVGQMGVDAAEYGPSGILGPMAEQVADATTQPFGETVKDAVAVGPLQMALKGMNWGS